MNKQGPEMRHTKTMETTETAGKAGKAEKTGKAGKAEGKRFDLSVPQVAGSALATVLAAKLASTLGVYGTIVGAGVISVIATCGGPVLQHLLKRTGEQMREVTVPRPKARQAAEPYESGATPAGEFGEPTTHGTRVRGWKRPALGAALVFLISMGGITAYELTSGQDLSGTRGTTTFGSVVSGQGGGGGGDGKGEERPAGGGTPDATPSAGAGQGDPGERTGGGDAPAPGDTPGTGPATPDTTPTPAPTPTPTPTPSGSTGPAGGATTAPPTSPPAAPAPESPGGTGAE
ncbi:hypothetical protein ABZ135_03415 [Streptomyces sp. NPDC006339]|uniref:hypothetical protein n=1 Tax=Streptomyces sp. NPDC006339 TaxID=3156755 RepID=UPI0033B38947